MKRVFLALMLVASAASVNAHAYGVKVHEPILVGPLAGAVYTEFMQMLANSGAVPCEIAMSSVCAYIHLVVVTGKRGRNRYIVGTATSMYIENTGLFRFAETRVVRHSESLKRISRSHKGPWFTAEEWGIDRLELPREHIDLRN